jgi:hypothetical protein
MKSLQASEDAYLLPHDGRPELFKVPYSIHKFIPLFYKIYFFNIKKHQVLRSIKNIIVIIIA